MVAPFLRPDGDLSPEEQRAGLAALAGPLRAPWGNQRPVFFPPGQTGALLAVSNAGSPRPLYCEIRQVAGAAATLVVGSSQNLQFGQNASYAPVLNVPIAFILMPGESMFIADAAGGPSTFLVTDVSV